MEDGTREDYLLLDESERRYAEGLGERVLESLKKLDHLLYGYPVSRLQHSLQAATRAARGSPPRCSTTSAMSSPPTTMRRWRRRSCDRTCGPR